MIPIYNIEDLTIDKIDTLIERGVVFDITSKTAVLPKIGSDNERDSFGSNRDKYARGIQQTDTK